MNPYIARDVSRLIRKLDCDRTISALREAVNAFSTCAAQGLLRPEQRQQALELADALRDSCAERVRFAGSPNPTGSLVQNAASFWGGVKNFPSAKLIHVYWQEYAPFLAERGVNWEREAHAITNEADRYAVVIFLKLMSMSCLRYGINWDDLPSVERNGWENAHKILNAIGMEVASGAALKRVPTWALTANPKRAKQALMTCKDDKSYVFMKNHWLESFTELPHMSSGTCADNEDSFDHVTDMSLWERKAGDWLWALLPNNKFLMYNGGNHSQFTCGQPVVAAGEIKIKHRKSVRLDHQSGHYRTPKASFFVAISLLMKKGIIPKALKIRGDGIYASATFALPISSGRGGRA